MRNVQPLCAAKTANNRTAKMASEVEPKAREIECMKENGIEMKESGEELTHQGGEKIAEGCQSESTKSNDTDTKTILFNESCSPSFLVQCKVDMENHEQDFEELSKRRNYRKFSAEERWQIGVVASEMGTTRAIRQLEKQYPGIKLAESTVRSFKNMYLREKRNSKTNLMPKELKTVRGKYQTYSEQDRAIIGKYAFANGNASAIRHFKDVYPRLSESTVRGFKNIYTKEVERRRDGGNLENHIQQGPDTTSSSIDGVDYKCNQEIRSPKPQCSPLTDQLLVQDSTTDQTMEINSLPRRKRGRPGKIPSEIEALVVTYLGAIAHKDEKLLTHEAVIAITKGFLMVEDR